MACGLRLRGCAALKSDDLLCSTLRLPLLLTSIVLNVALKIALSISALSISSRQDLIRRSMAVCSADVNIFGLSDAHESVACSCCWSVGSVCFVWSVESVWTV